MHNFFCDLNLFLIYLTVENFFFFCYIKADTVEICTAAGYLSRIFSL